MKINNKTKKTRKQSLLREPSKVMKLDRLGSFHQTRLSFSRPLIDQLKTNKWIIKISKWDIDKHGIGNAIISSVKGSNEFS